MKGLIRLLLPGILLIVSVSGARADEISLSASLNRTDIAFDSTVTLSMEIKWQGGVGRYAFEILPLPSAQKLQAMGSTSAVSSGTEQGREVTTRTFRYNFRPTQAGIGIIDPIVLKYISLPDSTPGQLTSQQFQVIIAAPVAKPVKSNNWKFIIAGVAAATVIAIIIVTVLGSRKKRKALPPSKTPEETFLEELALVKKESSLDRKIFFTRLYKMLTAYLESKYGMAVGGRPVAEVLAMIETRELPAGEKEQIVAWLTQAEKEKYAPVSGAPGDLIRIAAELENYFRK